MRILAVILSLVICFQAGFAQTVTESASDSDTMLFSKDFFDRSEPLDLELAFDIKKFMTEKSDSEYLPAKLKYYSADNNIIEKEVRIKARGEFRRNTCQFPPYWLNIKKSNVNNDHLSEAKKVKVVTHCKDSRAVGYEDYVLREYLIYKMYNIITEYSFRVRLLNIKYTDTGRNNKTYNKLAFMIEPEERMAERLEAYPLEMDDIKFSLTDTIMTVTMSIFNYMIGNTDYSISGRHNIKLLTLKDYTKPDPVPVPYDFDFAGLVNAFYANPRPELGIESVTERYFYGICRSDNLYTIVLDIFIDKKEEIYELLETFEPLHKRSRREIIKYIDEFYKEIDKDDFIENRLRTTCE
jgi:hypothetical protein